MDQGPDLVAAAVAPTATDLMRTRALVVEALSRDKVASMGELRQLLLSSHSVAPEHHREQVTVQGQLHAVTAIDDEHPLLLRQRLGFALNEVMTALIAEGVITRISKGEVRNEASVPASGPSWGGSIRFSHDHAMGPGSGRFRLTVASTPRVELTRDSLPSELADLLGIRGAEVLSEAIRAFHRGLFIAAVDLLSATSEAAWFTIAAGVRDDSKLADLVEAASNAAEVIHRTVEAASRAKAIERRTLTDLHAQAARLRDLRNYGLHPVGAHDEDREPAFSEAGAAALFMTAPRYFRQLDTLRVKLLASS